MKHRQPLNIEHWGKLEVWDGLDIPDIIAGVEPDRDPEAAWPIVAKEFMEIMTAAAAVGLLRPTTETSSGNQYFLASQMIQLAKEKRFAIPDGLEVRVRATAAAGLVHLLEAEQVKLSNYEAALRLQSASAPPSTGSPEGRAIEDGADVRSQLWKLADETAAAVRNGSASVSLNAVCKELCKQPARNANKELLHGQKGWHTESWLKKAGHLKGWSDPVSRK